MWHCVVDGQSDKLTIVVTTLNLVRASATEKLQLENLATKKNDGVGKKSNVKLVFRREGNSLFRLQNNGKGASAR